MRILAFAGGEGSPGKSVLCEKCAFTLEHLGVKTAVLDLSRRGERQGPRLRSFGSGRHEDAEFSEASAADEHAENELSARPGDGTIVSEAESFSGCLVSNSEQRFTDSDIVLVDAPHGVLDEHLAILGAAHAVVTVVTPETSLSPDTLFFINELERRCGIRPPRLVVNRAPSAQSADSICGRIRYGQDQTLGFPVDVIGYIPEDPEIRQPLRSDGPKQPDTWSSPGWSAVRDFSLRLMQLTGELPAEDKTAAFLSAVYNYLSSTEISESYVSSPDYPTYGGCWAEHAGGTAFAVGNRPHPMPVALFRTMIVEALMQGGLESADFATLYESVRDLVLASPGSGHRGLVFGAPC
ncbi:MAG: hypothetical protein V2B18_18315 [Pseudomonadota bacterium]